MALPKILKREYPKPDPKPKSIVVTCKEPLSIPMAKMQPKKERIKEMVFRNVSGSRKMRNEILTVK